MDLIQQLRDLIEKYYLQYGQVGFLGEGSGYLRCGYSREESKIILSFEKHLHALGFKVGYDKIGNFFAEYLPRNDITRFVEVASHVDSVPNGGNYDGFSGVVAGLAIFEALIKSGEAANLNYGLRFRIWRLEESATYKIFGFGSLGAFGKMDPALLDNKFNGFSLREAIINAGYSVESIEKNQRIISQEELDSIAAHFELHIEQATFLEKNSLDVGLITSVRGNKRFRIDIKGEFNHSGATPMGTAYRRDANLALAHLIVEMNSLLQVYSKNKSLTEADLVQTFGVINSDDDYNKKVNIYTNHLTKVSGYAYVMLDIRSNINSVLEDYPSYFFKTIKDIESRFNVEIKIEEMTSSSAVEVLSDKLLDLNAASAEKLSLSFQRMPSGAGHDASNLAKELRSTGEPIPVSLIFVPCRNGLSHHPDEFATSEQIAKGAAVIYQSILDLS